MMDYVPDEIYIMILNNLDLLELIKFEHINKQFSRVIRTNDWPHIIINSKKNKSGTYIG